MIFHAYEFFIFGTWPYVKTIVFVTGVFFSTHGCATKKEFTKVIPGQRFIFEGVTLLAPRGYDWYFQDDQAGLIQFVKPVDTKDQTIVGLAVLSKLPEIKSEEEFLALASKWMSEGEAGGTDPRFEPILTKEVISNERDDFCVRYHAIYKDYKPKNLPATSKFLIVENIGIFCRHPDNKNIGVEIAFSQRTQQDNGIPDFEFIADEFIKNATFIPFTKSDTEKGYAYFQKNNYQQAIDHFDKAIADNPEDYSAYFYRGFSLFRQKKYAMAISDWEKTISLKEDYINAYSNIAGAYRQIKNYKKALFYANTALKMASELNREQQLKKEIPKVYEMRGKINYELKKYTQVLQDYTKAIELNPEYVAAYICRGIEYERLSKYPQAIQDFNKAIDIDPNKANAYYNRGVVYHNQSRYSKAIYDYSKAIELEPKDNLAYYNRALIYAGQFKYAEAIQDYARGIAIDPKQERGYNDLGWLYATCKNQNFRDGDKAVKFALKAVSLQEEAGNLDTLGAAYVENKQYEKAIETYKKVIQKDKSFIKRYQKSLKDKGYYSGPLDGINTPEFENATRTCIMQGEYL